MRKSRSRENLSKFETLKPPYFRVRGVPATREEAIDHGLWISTVNVWVLKTKPILAIMYQQRSMSKAWAPGKLDVMIGGKVDAGESLVEAVKREAIEEVGVKIKESDLVLLGKNLHVGFSKEKYVLTVPHIYLMIDNRNISEYLMVDGEVEGIFEIPVSEILNLFEKDGYKFEASGLGPEGQERKITVVRDILPENWDNYHYKIARLAKKYAEGERDLIY